MNSIKKMMLSGALGCLISGMALHPNPQNLIGKTFKS